MPRAHLPASLTVVGALAASCGIPGDWTGETADGITLYTDEGITACAGVLPRIARLRERIAEELGVDPTPIDYYFTEDTANVAQVCQRSVPGCAFPSEGRVLYSDPDVVSSHELAHVLANRGLDPVPLTSEGLAVYFSSRRVVPIRLDVLPALNDPLEKDNGAAFVSYLIQTYGMDEVFAFHKSTWRGMSEDEFVRLFEERFSITLSELEDAVDQNPAPLTPPFDACDGPELEPTSDGFERRIDCDDDALGIRDRAYTHDIVKLDVATYRMRVEGADKVILQGCASGFEETWSDGPTYFASLSEGAYSMQIWAPEGSSEADAHVALQPIEVVTTCTPDASIPAEDVDPPATFGFSVVGPIAIPFQLTSPAILDAGTYLPPRICTEDCECTRGTGQPMELDAGRYWIELAAGHQGGDATFSVL